MHLLYTVNAPSVSWTVYTQRIPCYAYIYSECTSVIDGLEFRVTSAYTNASSLYGECTSFSWTIFRVTSAYTKASTLYGECTSVSWIDYIQGIPQRIPMHLLYTVNVPLLAGLYSGLPQRIPKNLLCTVNVPLLAGNPEYIDYIQGYLSIYQCIYFIR